MIASLLDACAKNGTARIAAITNTIAVVMSMDDAVAGACGLLDGSGVAPAPISLFCFARSCNCTAYWLASLWSLIAKSALNLDAQ